MTSRIGFAGLAAVAAVVGAMAVWKDWPLWAKIGYCIALLALIVCAAWAQHTKRERQPTSFIGGSANGAVIEDCSSDADSFVNKDADGAQLRRNRHKGRPF